MSRKFIIEAPTKTYVEGIAKDLSRVRQWIEGFEAAGKKGPPHADALRKAQILLDRITDVGTITDTPDSEGEGE
jgi:hypothetical protein